MKTLLKSKIVLLALAAGFLFSCRGNDNKQPQHDPMNGSETTADTTTTEDNYNTDGTTVAPASTNANSGEPGTTSAGSREADPSALGPSSNSSGATGSGMTDGTLPGGKPAKKN